MLIADQAELFKGVFCCGTQEPKDPERFTVDEEEWKADRTKACVDPKAAVKSIKSNVF